MIEELKKCPFCGGEAVFSVKSNCSTYYSVGFSFGIECKDCGIKTPKTYKVEFNLAEDGTINPLHDERGQAANDWNKRK